MRLFTSLITLLALTLLTFIHASPIPLELLNGRDVAVVLVRNDNINLSELPARSVAAREHDTNAQRRSPIADSAPDTQLKRNIDAPPAGPSW